MITVLDCLLFINFWGTVRAIKEAARLYSVSLVTVRIRNILSALRVTLKNSRHCVAPRVVINCGSHTHTHGRTLECVFNMYEKRACNINCARKYAAQ